MYIYARTDKAGLHTVHAKHWVHKYTPEHIAARMISVLKASRWEQPHIKHTHTRTRERKGTVQ